MVLDAYREFSPEIAEVAKLMMDKQHIDWLPSKTKGGGAFCAYGGKSSYPYVLLNYTNKPRDVMTLAHELGHATHDVLANKENVFLEVHPSLALAEIASVFGEILLYEKLIKSDELSKQDRIALIMSFIEDRFATVFRQVTMFQFEQALHKKRREEGELPREEIDELWDSVMRKPFGDTLVFTPEHKNTWMYVGHIFHVPFYVYSYAFAQLCVLALYKQYLEKGKDFVPTYLQILRSGGSLSPKDNLARAGLDITHTNFWLDGLEVLKDSVDELDQLVK